MLQYLLNTTAIWLMSIVLFDVFLQGESYHKYNRGYLLFTFLLGALLPLWQWQDASMPYAGTFEKPIEQVIYAKQTLVAATTATTSMQWEPWFAGIYLAGALVALALLVIDILKLASYYSAGSKTIEDGWTVITTGKDHAPFSFRNSLFVSSKDQYNDEEWSMILLHEGRHTTLLHFADLMLMQLARILFWFHPLVYVYNKRLLLIHEYQADNTAARKPALYGAFMVEQAMLQAAPSISNSFNRSPIKKRILMLTRKSTAASRTKMLVFVPLALVCILCFSKNGFSQRFVKNGNKVTYKGNTFELSEPKVDTFTLVDPITKNEMTRIVRTVPMPLKMNGKLITLEPDQQPEYTGSDKDLADYLLKNMREELGNLNDGLYSIDMSEVTIDERGQIVYFDYREIKRHKTADEAGAINPTSFKQVSKKEQQVIFNKVCRLMDAAPAFTPAKLNGKKVISNYNAYTYQSAWNDFKIKDHKIYVKDKDGQYKEL
jgi:hypothetical protein